MIAQDPLLTAGGKILRSAVEVPSETLAPGPCGYRACVIDYDSTTDTLYAPLDLGSHGDPFEQASDDELLGDPQFHQQNVYALVMCTLARFEFALGRRVPWSLRGHQLKIAPHAFSQANAFYSERDESLMLGYFPTSSGKGNVFSCLSHDVVAHETAHALVDGLRTRYTDPSSPDQAAFHEGFADVVALLSVFAQEPVVEALLPHGGNGDARTIKRTELTAEALRQSALFGLAEQMGQEMQGIRGQPLRHSLGLARAQDILDRDDFVEPHRRGEVFVAAVLGAFVDVWALRIARLGTREARNVDRSAVVEAGAEIADHLLTLCIRALDYTPPVDLQFADFLAAVLTADAELFPDDGKYEFRHHLRESFGFFGIHSPATATQEGLWLPTDCPLHYDRNHVEPLQRDRDEVFRFLWENRVALEVDPAAYCEVLSVRPCMRQGRDGFFLRETVAEYVEILRLQGRELGGIGLRVPGGVAAGDEVSLYGGGTLIFDEFSRLKFHVKNNVRSRKQQVRLDYLAASGFFHSSNRRSFAELHLQRATAMTTHMPQSW